MKNNDKDVLPEMDSALRDALREAELQSMAERELGLDDDEFENGLDFYEFIGDDDDEFEDFHDEIAAVDEGNDRNPYAYLDDEFDAPKLEKIQRKKTDEGAPVNAGHDFKRRQENAKNRFRKDRELKEKYLYGGPKEPRKDEQ